MLAEAMFTPAAACAPQPLRACTSRLVSSRQTHDARYTRVSTWQVQHVRAVTVRDVLAKYEMGETVGVGGAVPHNV